MANSVDPDQTAPIGAVCSGSTLFASLLNSSVMLGIFFFAADDLSGRHFQMHFFLGELRVKVTFYSSCKFSVKKSCCLGLYDSQRHIGQKWLSLFNHVRIQSLWKAWKHGKPLSHTPGI